MNLFFINQATYVEVSRPFVPLSDVENLGLSLHSKKQKL